MGRYQIFVFLLLLVFTSLYSQENLSSDKAFFEKKTQLYQHWLNKKGIGNWLEVDKLQLAKKETELELILTFHSTLDTDTAAWYWAEMNRNFEEKNKGLKLDSVLYTTFTRMMEIQPEYGNIQIYVNGQGSMPYDTCFYIWIWEKEDIIRQESKTFGCLKSQTLNIPIEMPSIQSLNQEGTLEIQAKKNAEEVFHEILKYSKSRYESTTCENRNPKVEEDEMTDYKLVFTVTDLCKEVLTDEDQSIWCDLVEFWGGTCNDTRRERLEFIFHFIPTTEGYLLSGSLTGKFGSGFYKPRRSAYMDMDPDFEEDYLVPYAKSLQKDLKRFLEERP